MTEAILFSGGIGDILTIESFIKEKDRNSLQSIYYATRAHKVIQEIMKALPNYPNLKEHIVLHEDFSKIFAFHNKAEVISAMINAKNVNSIEKNQYARINAALSKVQDYSISKIFMEIPNMRPYTGSSFLKFKVSDIKQDLPENFIIICPFSADKRNPKRDFNEKDWQFTIKFLQNNNMKGLVLNSGPDFVPSHELIIDFSNKTTFLESIEIMKKAKGYIGIDSCLSVLAAKLFNPPLLIVKSNNGHLFSNLYSYYYPQKNFKFVKRNLE